MKNKILILLSFLALSCGNEDDSQPNITAMDLVTGVNLRQSFDDIPLQLGNPNVLVNNKFVIYPNPVNEVVYISATENVTDVWVVPAKAKKIYQDHIISTFLDLNLYSEQSISSHADFSLNGQDSNSFGVNIGALEKGYYRIFVKINGEIYWDNLYKYESPGSNEEQFAVIYNFWN